MPVLPCERAYPASIHSRYRTELPLTNATVVPQLTGLSDLEFGLSRSRIGIDCVVQTYLACQKSPFPCWRQRGSQAVGADTWQLTYQGGKKFTRRAHVFVTGPVQARREIPP